MAYLSDFSRSSRCVGQTVNGRQHPGATIRDYTVYEPGLYFPEDVRDEGRYYGLGVRFRFGE